MRKSTVKKAFTLVEILIVMVIAVLLLGVLFQVYRNISDVALRVRYEKEVGNKIVTMQTILQNIFDTHVIRYDALTGVTWNWEQWWTNTIPLSTTDNIQAQLTLDSGAIVYTTFTWWVPNSAAILGSNAILSQATFVIMPLSDPQITNTFSQIYQPWVWLIWSLTLTDYKTTNTAITFPVQTYFTTLQR